MAELHVVSALRAKCAELSGQIADLEKRLGQAGADLVHLDAVLRLFASELEPTAIAPKAVRRCNTWFQPGECPRLVLDMLRTAGEPLITREITGRLMTAKGMDPADGRTRELVHKTVAATLNRLGAAVEGSMSKYGRSGVVHGVGSGSACRCSSGKHWDEHAY
jgi:hypothetical protein